MDFGWQRGDDNEQTIVLTTTIDGLWVLQVLAGVESLPPELALRPTLPDIETARMAMAHPVAHELCTQGVIPWTRPR
ncbi:hypothetical protein A5710_03140 [Mycolicibacter sinensis]|uniref:Uncharacterized protein n=1 Tax=Mycolicibacter sinensis (strain JDM601) TaxID=875328 RepID=A0A1A2XUE6_MYCSD|nr:hypothetical protein A5694_13940 [Mycolicibacter sinensis]OBI28526.1 hypothetical protein A5710_03140 [Mycolicibacter sinensis]